jgi:hypothetical protein
VPDKDYNSPLVAVIKTQNDVESAIIEQLEALF